MTPEDYAAAHHRAARRWSARLLEWWPVAYLLSPWRQLPDLQVAVMRHGARLTKLEGTQMSADRDLLAAAAVCLPVIAEGVAALEGRLATITQERDDALVRLGEERAAAAADETDDAAAIAPLAESLQALAAKFRPAAEAPDTTTPEAPATPTDVPAVIEAAPVADDGSTEATGETG